MGCNNRVPGGADRRSSQMASFSLRRKVKEFVRTNVDDFLNPFFWVEVLVEFILCTFVSIIVIWALTTINPARYNPSSTHFAIFAGVAIIALIEGYGPLCGAPVNPVGVWGFLIVGRISLVKGKNLSEISVTKSTFISSRPRGLATTCAAGVRHLRPRPSGAH